jgi:hypothetical protein
MDVSSILFFGNGKLIFPEAGASVAVGKMRTGRVTAGFVQQIQQFERERHVAAGVPARVKRRPVRSRGYISARWTGCVQSAGGHRRKGRAHATRGIRGKSRPAPPPGPMGSVPGKRRPNCLADLGPLGGRIPARPARPGLVFPAHTEPTTRQIKEGRGGREI